MDMLRGFIVQTALVVFLFTQTSSTQSPAYGKNTTSCFPRERSALLTFRAGLSDPLDRLSSWKGDYCCQWMGVQCSNRTGHVIKLDLHGDAWSIYFNGMRMYTDPRGALGGTISSSLLGLRHLRYLDLSHNTFDGVRIPEFLGSLYKLRYLDLSMSRFIGMVPPQLGNLSNLRYLNLDSDYGDVYSTDITWLSRLSSLENLRMEKVNLSTVLGWPSVVNMIPSLRVVDLSGCQLSDSPNPPFYNNLTSVETLDIRGNNIYEQIVTNWLWDLPSLKYLDISYNSFYGALPYKIGNLTSIVKLELSDNNLVGMIPSNMKSLCNLKILDLSSNNINGSMTELLDRLHGCSWRNLEMLFLSYCNLTGSLPTTLEPSSNLTWLDLSSNNLTGPVPLWIGELTNLTELTLSYNNLDGAIYEEHLSGLRRLERLSLSGNSIAITVNSTWVPPTNLTDIQLRSCRIGPEFPTWLRWQTRLFNLDISNASISDVVPDWFWKAASSASIINMRFNEIQGSLPSSMEFMALTDMDLSYNQFNGPLPKLPTTLISLDISKNNLSGPLPLNLLEESELAALILFDNSISGAIPSSLCKMQFLRLLDISGNKLTGPIPDCTGNSSSTELRISNISLRDNKLSGQFPSFLRNCKNLIFLDLAHNQFSGTLPTWIGEKLPSLVFLRLRSNLFCGHIPVELTRLSALQYLDLANNNLSGSAPESMMNFHRMMIKQDKEDNYSMAITFGTGMEENVLDNYIENITIVTKGQERIYTGEILYMVNIDLSCNNLTGEIPKVIGTLVALTNLNLSWNSLTGEIPEKIGSLSQLESLDLSHNMLSGEIPNSIASLTYLSHMNLSYNNLSGRIPRGNQLDVLEDPASIYIGNIGLCGYPLPNNCSLNADSEIYRDELDKVSFLLSTIIGFVVGILPVFYLMLLSSRWRHTCFMFVDGLYDRMHVQVAIACRRLRKTS